MSAARLYRPSVYGGRHNRKKSKRPLPLPKRPIPDKRRCVSPRDDEDYVNLGHRHKLTYIRYPSGSGKRPPPKPKRIGAIQEVGSPPPPSLRSPPPVAAPRTQPKQSPRPKVAPRSTSPSQQQQLGVTTQATPTEHTQATPTGRMPPPGRPLLPPNRKLQKVRSVESNLEGGQGVWEPKRVPPRPRPKPQACPDSLSCPERRYSVDQDKVFNLNGYTNDKKYYECSLPAQLVHASKPPKQPVVPPAVKPRKPRPSSSKKQDSRINLNLNEPGTSLQQKPPASLPFLTSPKRRSPPLPSLSPDQETNGKLPHYLPYVSELQNNMKAPMPKPRARKPSRGDDIDPSLSYSSQAHPAEPERSVEESLVSPSRPTARRRLGSKGALPTPHRTEGVVASPRYQDEFITSVPLCLPPTTPRGTDSAREKCTSMQVQAPALKAPPTPRRRVNKTVSESDVRSKSSPVNIPTPYHQLTLRTRRKGGGIRVPLWKAPPPPTWTPPQTPTQKNPNRKERSSSQLLLPLSSLHVSPPSTPTFTTSTSFILPPFRCSGLSPYPSSDEMERSWVMECEPMVEIARSSCSSPTPKSPLTVDFEENLFNCRRGPGYPGFQQQLPINVVQELQNNLRKQILTRSGM